MVAKNIAKEFGEFASRFICKKVALLIRRHRFPKSERESLMQDFALRLHVQRAHYDPTVATWEAFVIVVCENLYVNLIRKQRAKMRAGADECESLHQSVRDAEGQWTEKWATLPESQRGRHTRQTRRDEQDLWELQHDVADTVGDMPPKMLQLCELLMCGSKAHAARVLGVSQGGLYELLGRALARFERADLREYLK
jgi:DNA-directed RNA polymerase specialized sigma24 family protein